KWRIRFNVVYG
ncbi:hypothetical protein D039_4278B, partial [Vibrio parahaemolyticus EKP-028]